MKRLTLNLYFMRLFMKSVFGTLAIVFALAYLVDLIELSPVSYTHLTLPTTPYV
mgnify:CR=1 FL=1